jgi:hypothetical protein
MTQKYTNASTSFGMTFGQNTVVEQKKEYRMFKNKILIAALIAAPLTANATSDVDAKDWLTMPIADVHRHVYNGPHEHTSVADVLDSLKRNNVRWAGGVGDGGRSQLRKALGRRYISAYGQAEWTRVFFQEGGNHALENPANFPTFLRDFDQGDFDGIGEIHTNSLGRARRDTPIDGPMMLKMYKHLNKKGGWIQIHHSARRAPYQDVIKVALQYPNVRFILSHCMFDNMGSVMRKVFDQTNNTYCEISATGPVRGGAQNRTGRIYDEDGLNPAWLNLMQDHPTRVMLGSDTCCGLNNRYDDIIYMLRHSVLKNLPEPVRSNVAYRNALKVFRLPY